MAASEIERLIRLMSRLPGLGPRSARRAVLALLKRPETLMQPLVEAMRSCMDQVRTCSICGNLDSRDPCSVCDDPNRDRRFLCVVQEVEDLWAMDRSGSFKGLYHVLGGTLSAFDGRGPDDLRIGPLTTRVEAGGIEEVVLALGATVDGQTTAHYIAEHLKPLGCTVSRLGHGVPLGGELNYLDDGTLDAAFRGRQRFG